MAEYELQASQIALCTADRWLTSVDPSPTGKVHNTDRLLPVLQTDG